MPERFNVLLFCIIFSWFKWNLWIIKSKYFLKISSGHHFCPSLNIWRSIAVKSGSWVWLSENAWTHNLSWSASFGAGGVLWFITLVHMTHLLTHFCSFVFWIFIKRLLTRLSSSKQHSCCLTQMQKPQASSKTHFVTQNCRRETARVKALLHV